MRCSHSHVEAEPPSGETGAVGWAAGIGAEARATLLEAGAVIGDLRACVTRIESAGPSVARVTLVFAAASTPP